ncbi:MFS transporter [Streptomyces sp. TM32]|uniref:MFS transporter n=1 Tax=Streptomyces sp. TM32 TaxID=1652669 RepID=UPI0010137D9F|nr:MFS transporter [Streptomyces sp. TM32]RXS84899.1 MFS transporter [Streptomyces sp. TM32]
MLSRGGGRGLRARCPGPPNGSRPTWGRWTYAIAAPLLTALTAGWGQRRILVLSQLVFTVGMVLQAVGPALAVVAAGRVIAAAGAATYTRPRARRRAAW